MQPHAFLTRALLIVLIGWARSAIAAEPVTVVAGFGINKPPYVIESQNSGLEVELVRAAFKAAGVEMKTYFAPQVRLHSLMENRRIEVITATNETSGITPYYSDVYIIYRNYAITLSSRKDIVLNRVEDLAHYTVTSFARAQKVLGKRFADAVAKSPKYSEPPQQSTRDLMLYSGRVDIAVGDRRIFDYYRPDVGKLTNINQPVTYHDILPPTLYKIGFRDATLRDRFNAGLTAIRKNGEYEAITRKYQPHYESD